MTHPVNSSSDSLFEDISEQFWQWSCAVYGYSEVRQQCLQLQNRFELNINYLLLALYLERKSIDLTENDWRKVISDGQKINAQVHKIRSKRLKFKGKDNNVYQDLLALELKGERIIQKTALKSVNKHLVNKCKVLKKWTDALEKTETNRNLQVYIATCIDEKVLEIQANALAKTLNEQIKSSTIGFDF